jgi:transcriptional regulator with XRE-family HTH domain
MLSIGSDRVSIRVLIEGVPVVDGERVRWWRRKRLLTLRALSERSGIAYTTIHGIETGKHDPRPSTILRLAEALDVDPDALMESEPGMGKAAA